MAERVCNQASACKLLAWNHGMRGRLALRLSAAAGVETSKYAGGDHHETGTLHPSQPFLCLPQLACDDQVRVCSAWPALLPVWLPGYLRGTTGGCGRRVARGGSFPRHSWVCARAVQASCPP